MSIRICSLAGFLTLLHLVSLSSQADLLIEIQPIDSGSILISGGLQQYENSGLEIQDSYCSLHAAPFDLSSELYELNAEDDVLLDESQWSEAGITSESQLVMLSLEQFDLPWLSFVWSAGDTARSCFDFLSDAEQQLELIQSIAGEARKGSVLLPFKISMLKRKINQAIRELNQAYEDSVASWISQGEAKCVAEMIALGEVSELLEKVYRLKGEKERAEELLRAIREALPTLDSYRDILKRRIAECAAAGAGDAEMDPMSTAPAPY